MGIITLVVLGLTLVGLAFGALFGFLRGRERALLRLVLVVISAFLALALRGAVVDAVMNINIDGATLNETLMSGFSSGDASLPDGLKNLVFALLEIVIGFVAYFILLFALRFLSWLLVFPFLKLIIRVFEKKRKEQIALANASDIDESSDIALTEANETASEYGESAELASENADELIAEETASSDDAAEEDGNPFLKATSTALEFIKKIAANRKKPVKEFSKHRGQGALVGLVQGVLVAYFLFAPLTCLLTQINRITSLEMNGKPLVEMPEEIGISEYSESAIGKFYASTGGWYYKIMTTTTDANGNKVSLDSTLKSVAVILEVANVATSLEDDLKIFDKEDATPEEIISSLNSLSDKLISVGTSLNEIDEGTKNMIKDLVVEMGGADASQEEIDEMMDKLTPELFTQAGNAMKTYAEYEQVKLDGSALTQDQANDMVEKAYGSLKLIGDMQLDVNEADKPAFKAAIDNNPNIAEEDIDDMYKVFGLLEEPNPAD